MRRDEQRPCRGVPARGEVLFPTLGSALLGSLPWQWASGSVVPGLSARWSGSAGDADDKEFSNRGSRVIPFELYKFTTHTKEPCMNVYHAGSEALLEPDATSGALSKCL